MMPQREPWTILDIILATVCAFIWIWAIIALVVAICGTGLI